MRVLEAVGKAILSLTLWTEHPWGAGCVDSGFALRVGAGGGGRPVSVPRRGCRRGG